MTKTSARSLWSAQWSREVYVESLCGLILLAFDNSTTDTPHGTGCASCLVRWDEGLAAGQLMFVGGLVRRQVPLETLDGVEKP